MAFEDLAVGSNPQTELIKESKSKRYAADSPLFMQNF